MAPIVENAILAFLIFYLLFFGFILFACWKTRNKDTPPETPRWVETELRQLKPKLPFKG